MDQNIPSGIIVVFGLPGSGKSYFATKLAGKLNAEYISSDITRKQIATQPDYSDQERLNVYDIMMEEAVKALANTNIVVLDATFFLRSARDKLVELVAQHHIDIRFIEIIADENIIKERVAKKRQHSDADFSVYLKVTAQFEPMDKQHLVLESKRDNIDEMLRSAIHYLEQNKSGDG